MANATAIHGTVKKFGRAPYKNDPANNASYYVTLTQNDNEKTFWGNGLEDAIKEADIKENDVATFIDKGTQSVSVPDKNNVGEFIQAKKRFWEAEKYTPSIELQNTIEQNLELDIQANREAELPINDDLNNDSLNLSKGEAIQVDLAARRELPDSIENNYIVMVKNRFLRDAKLHFYDKEDRKSIAFEDRTSSLATSKNDPKTVKAMLDLAQHKKWSSISIKGDPEFKRQVWLEAQLRGMDVTRGAMQIKGFNPTEADRAELKALQESRTNNTLSNNYKESKEINAQTDALAQAEAKQNNDQQMASNIPETTNDQLADITVPSADGTVINNVDGLKEKDETISHEQRQAILEELNTNQDVKEVRESLDSATKNIPNQSWLNDAANTKFENTLIEMREHSENTNKQFSKAEILQLAKDDIKEVGKGLNDADIAAINDRFDSNINPSPELKAEPEHNQDEPDLWDGVEISLDEANEIAQRELMERDNIVVDNDYDASHDPSFGFEARDAWYDYESLDDTKQNSLDHTAGQAEYDKDNEKAPIKDAVKAVAIDASLETATGGNYTTSSIAASIVQDKLETKVLDNIKQTTVYKESSAAVDNSVAQNFNDQFAKYEALHNNLDAYNKQQNEASNFKLGHSTVEPSAQSKDFISQDNREKIITDLSEQLASDTKQILIDNKVDPNKATEIANTVKYDIKNMARVDSISTKTIKPLDSYVQTANAPIIREFDNGVELADKNTDNILADRVNTDKLTWQNLDRGQTSPSEQGRYAETLSQTLREQNVDKLTIARAQAIVYDPNIKDVQVQQNIDKYQQRIGEELYNAGYKERSMLIMNEVSDKHYNIQRDTSANITSKDNSLSTEKDISEDKGSNEAKINFKDISDDKGFKEIKIVEDVKIGNTAQGVKIDTDKNSNAAVALAAARLMVEEIYKNDAQKRDSALKSIDKAQPDILAGNKELPQLEIKQQPPQVQIQSTKSSNMDRGR